MRVEPDHGQPVLAGGQTFDRADVRATAAAEDERAFRQIRGEGKILLLERVGLDDGGLRIGKLEPGGLSHRLTALPPGLRYSHHSRQIHTSARVALVFGPECDRRVGLAVGTLRAQATHVSSFLNATASYAMCIPARS